MHDQRTIFSVGNKNNPATLSFLAPSEDKKRKITSGRIKTMRVINSMASLLKLIIPNQIGRYTDEFYPTATGDNFQKLGYNTILIESGHYKNDYQREKTRKYTFFALLQGILFISNKTDNMEYKMYFDIPDNEKKYLDIILKNAIYKRKLTDIGILFIEKLKKSKIYFVPTLEKIEDLSSYNANTIIDCTNLSFKNSNDVKIYLKSKGY
jgi:hypothetical protein